MAWKPPGVTGPLPIFTAEGPQFYQAAFRHNRAFAKPSSGGYQTRLTPAQERQFRLWVRAHRVPFDPNARTVDYDMRGYWKATGGRGWSPGQHFPDLYKTPYDTSFSAESLYATRLNPFRWRGNTLVDTRTGSPVFRA